MTINKSEETKEVGELRKRLKSIMDPELLHDDYFIQRFLTAQDGDVDSAETMIKKHLEWRKKYDLKNILKNYKKPEVLEKYSAVNTLGYDKEGSLLLYIHLGKIDMPGILHSCTREDMAKYIFHELELEEEELKKQSEKLGKNIDMCVYIIDTESFSFAKATDKKVLQFIILMFDIFVNNYPERLKRGYAINTPVYFNVVYSIMKAILPKKIISKIHIYSNDSFKEDILQIVDADVLPKFLGGKGKDPEIKPSDEKVPEKYYISKNRQTLSQVPGIKKVTLANAAFHEDFLEVKDAGSYLEWEFETKCRDIGFGLFFQENIEDGEKITELIPIQRIDTEEYPETGTYMCEKPGTYVILFDNTYSWVRSKEIYFRTKVITPKEHEAEMQH